MTNPMPSSPVLVGNRPAIPSPPAETYRPIVITCWSYILKIEPSAAK